MKNSSFGFRQATINILGIPDLRHRLERVVTLTRAGYPRNSDYFRESTSIKEVTIIFTRFDSIAIFSNLRVNTVTPPHRRHLVYISRRQISKWWKNART